MDHGWVPSVIFFTFLRVLQQQDLTMDHFLNSNFTSNEEAIAFGQRRKAQNRIAQRKFRAKAKARQRQNSSTQIEILNNEPPQHTHLDSEMSRMECTTNVDGHPGLMFGGSFETEFPLTYNTPTTPELPQQKGQSSTCLLQNQLVAFSVDSDIKETSGPNIRVPEVTSNPWFMSTDLRTRYETYNQPQATDGMNFDHTLATITHETRKAQALSKTSDRSLTDRPDSGISDNLEQVHPIVNQQRAELCEQAEQLVKGVLSLYDIGISLGILMSDSDLRNLLVKALDKFHLQKSAE